MTRAEIRTVEDWCRTNWEENDKAHLSIEGVAKAAEKALGRRITRGNIVGAYRAMDLKAHVVPPSYVARADRAVPGNTAAMDPGLLTAVESLTMRVKDLTEAVLLVAEELGRDGGLNGGNSAAS